MKLTSKSPPSSGCWRIIPGHSIRTKKGAPADLARAVCLANNLHVNLIDCAMLHDSGRIVVLTYAGGVHMSDERGGKFVPQPPPEPPPTAMTG